MHNRRIFGAILGIETLQSRKAYLLESSPYMDRVTGAVTGTP